MAIFRPAAFASATAFLPGLRHSPGSCAADVSGRDVEEVILRPMQRLYLPPRHLRQYDPEDPDAKAEALAEYRSALERFPREVLDRAWRRLREAHEYSIWPTPAAICRLAAAEQLRSQTPSETEARRQRAWASASAYADRFMRRRQVAKLAAREGWSGRLRAYVEAAAWVQAQLIEGLAEKGVSLPPELLRGTTYRSAREALAGFQQAFAGPVTDGLFELMVPKALVAHWKQEAAQPPPASHPLPVDTVLDRLRGKAGR